MADFELKKLNRGELIEIIYAFQQNEKEQNSKIAKLEQELADKKVHAERTPTESSAEGVSEVYKVIEAAKQASEAYTEANARKADEILAKATVEAEQEAKRIRNEAQVEASKIVAEAHDEAGRIISNARSKAERRRRNLEKVIKQFCEDNPGINLECRSISKLNKSNDKE